MDVHLLWHVRHARNLDGTETEHRDPSGEVLIDEDFEDVKLVGVFSSSEAAASAVTPATDPGRRGAGPSPMSEVHRKRETAASGPPG